jgi:hypothetical protein
VEDEEDEEENEEDTDFMPSDIEVNAAVREEIQSGTPAGVVAVPVLEGAGS